MRRIAQQLTQPAPAAQPPTPAPPKHTTEPAAVPTNSPYSTSLYTCLAAAVRVAADVEKFAASIGRPLSFTTPDIRAMGASLYIEHSKQNGGRS